MINYSSELILTPGARRALAAMENPMAVRQALAQALDRSNELTVNRIQMKLSGEVLRVRTGLLRRSIGRTQAVIDGNLIRSSLGSGSAFNHEAVIYAAPLEYGSKPHEIVPRYKKFLRFVINGAVVFTKRVQHPGNRPYAYIRDTLQERWENYSLSLSGAVMRVYRGEPA